MNLKFWKRKQLPKPILSRTEFLPVYMALNPSGSFMEELRKGLLGSDVLALNSFVPSTPYAKLKIEVIEVNEKYDFQR